MKENLSQEALERIMCILKRGNVVEIKREKDKYVIIEIRRKALYKD